MAESSFSTPEALDVAEGPRRDSADRTAQTEEVAKLVGLMVRYQEGHAEASHELTESLRPPLRSYLISLARDVTRAEDLVQETFLQLHRSRHTYRPPRPVRPWAFGIARYVFLMDRRSTARRMRIFEDRLEALPELPVPALGLAFSDRDAVQRALSELPASHREIVLLHHVWGFTFSEIAQTLGIREGAAKVRSHRGMKKLRQMLGSHSDA